MSNNGNQKEVIVLDAEVLSTFQNCAKKLEYAHVRHLEPLALNKPGYFEKGDLMHDLLRLYRTLKMRRPLWNEDKIIKLCCKLADKRFPKMSFSIEDKDMIVEHFIAYTKRYQTDRCTTISVEKPFIKIMYESDELAIAYQGKPDWVVTNWPQIESEVFPIDTKTSERARDPFLLSNQFIGYAWALGAQRLIVDKIYFYKHIDMEKSFKRYVKYYHQDLIDEWVDSTIQWALAYRDAIKLGKFPRNLTSCDKYSGCIFQGVCSAVPSNGQSLEQAREYILTRDFKTRERAWDVGRVLEDV